ncbi:helix-turn-helix domain-containing protein [Cyanobium sp. Lug-B]|uniref:helix-turn-helix domain-containing protein n=1 Tax=Cyanobium sp. Lug-B TaxID=2823716 RepID=UPI0020CF2E77|nr:leucine zipper domain-containing protein [Cyanobium sp. Lug-B]MCP9796125.1 helix-turn-helix domain-containing protein [Cyanobium sp. Lug-B]
MHTHPNARLTQIGRERLIRQHLDEGRSLAQLAADHGINERSARKWLARFRSGGPSALVNRRSVRRSQRRTLDPEQLQEAVELKHQRCTLPDDRSAAAGADQHHGPGDAVPRAEPAAEPRPKPPVQRYQWEQPGDTIHADFKRLARFHRVGHRNAGDPPEESSSGGATRRCSLQWMTPPACLTSRS